MAKKKAVKKADPKVVETGTEIRKSNQTFLSLKSIGNLDSKGKLILSLGYGGRIVAPPDRGLALIIKVVQELAQMVSYSSDEAAENDLRLLKEYINDLEIVKSKKEKECQKS